MRWLGIIDADGSFLAEDASAYQAHVERLRGFRVWVEVVKASKPRSQSQNAYLWGVCYATISDWCGHDPEEIHEAMKLRFLGEVRQLPGGGELRTVRSTTRLDTEAFARYVEYVRAWAAELGVLIPDP